MTVKQLSINFPNEPGRFLAVSEYLGAEGINIRALSVSSYKDISTLRMVVDDPAKCLNVLISRGFPVEETDVIAIEVPDHPGGMQAILKPLKSANINLLFLYTFLGRGASGQPIVIISVDKTEEALKVLNKNWVAVLGKEIYTL